MSEKIAVVTGCSKGIGLATAKHLCSLGYKVFALSRNKELMDKELKDCSSIITYKIDLCESLEIDKFAEYLNNKKIDILVNNAGGGGGGSVFADDNPSNWTNAYNINVVAPMYLTRKLLNNFNRFANVFTVSSLAGYYPIHEVAGYSAAKRAESSMSDSLRHELARKDIRFTEVIPGSVNTGPEEKPAAIEPEDIAGVISWISRMPSKLNIDSIITTHIHNLKR